MKKSESTVPSLFVVKMEKIPAVMATQHPDCASRSISVNEEVEEAIISVTPFREGGFGCDEVMVDYEGKLTPYHQPRWIVEKALERGLKPGETFILTPRIPHAQLESIDRQILVMLSMLSANARPHLVTDPVRFVIHPMTASTSDLIDLRRRLVKLQKFAKEEMGLGPTSQVTPIPLFEDAVKMLHISKILESYRGSISKELGLYEDALRIFIGKSDTALCYGHMASVLALKYALSELGSWAEEENIHISPIIGVGKLPFRGHLSPENVEAFVNEYKGFYTVTIQSGLRYDVGKDGTAKVVLCLKDNRGRRPSLFDENTKALVVRCIRTLTREYLKAILPIAEKICWISDAIPGRRARVERVVYHREIMRSASFSRDHELLRIAHEAALPRAIRFTASLYTLGIPPTVIGLGRGLRIIVNEMGDETLETLLRIYPNIASDLRFDFQFLDVELARSYLRDVWPLLEADIGEAKELLGVEAEEADVSKSNSQILRRIKKKLGSPDVGALILEAGKLRGSLG